jgi:hypothetical protein
MSLLTPLIRGKRSDCPQAKQGGGGMEGRDEPHNPYHHEELRGFGVGGFQHLCDLEQRMRQNEFVKKVNYTFYRDDILLLN